MKMLSALSASFILKIWSGSRSCSLVRICDLLFAEFFFFCFLWISRTILQCLSKQLTGLLILRVIIGINCNSSIQCFNYYASGVGLMSWNAWCVPRNKRHFLLTDLGSVQCCKSKPISIYSFLYWGSKTNRDVYFALWQRSKTILTPSDQHTFNHRFHLYFTCQFSRPTEKNIYIYISKLNILGNFENLVSFNPKCWFCLRKEVAFLHFKSFW